MDKRALHGMGNKVLGKQRGAGAQMLDMGMYLPPLPPDLPMVYDLDTCTWLVSSGRVHGVEDHAFKAVVSVECGHHAAQRHCPRGNRYGTPARSPG